MSSFQVTTSTERVVCDDQGRATFLFSVRNAGELDRWALLRVTVNEKVAERWISIAGSERRRIAAQGSEVVNVDVRVPLSADTTGSYTLRLQVVAEDNPDADHAASQTVELTVRPPPDPVEKKPRPKLPWIIAAIAAALLVLFVVLYFTVIHPPAKRSCLAWRESGKTTDGPYWLDTGTRFQAFCDMQTDGGGWTMVYKHSAGVVGDLARDFTSGDSGDRRALLDRNKADADHANPMITTAWDQLTEARVEVLKERKVVEYLLYDLRDSSPRDFFTRSRLVGSSWTDLLASGQNIWSMQGDTANQRSFMINGMYMACTGDSGWLTTTSGRGCPWDATRANAILYAAAPTQQNWTSGQVGQADALAVFVREHRPANAPPRLARSCDELRRAGTSANGVYTIDPDHSGVGMRVFCDMSTEGGGWTLVYKHSAGVDKPVFETLASQELNPGDEALMSRDRSTSDYASRLLASRSWSTRSEARVEILAGGTVRQFMVYNAAGTSVLDFMRRDTLVRSSWTDLLGETQNFWSVLGDRGCGPREMFINRNYGGCEIDAGWLVSYRGSGCGCAWEVNNPNTIRYATTPTVQNWNGPNVASAEALAIFVR